MTTQSKLNKLENNLNGKKRPENVVAGGDLFYLNDEVTFDGGETVNAVVNLSSGIPVGSIIDLSKCSFIGAALSGVSVSVSGRLKDGTTEVVLAPATSIAAAGTKPFNASGNLVVVENKTITLKITAGTAAAAATQRVQIGYYIR